MLREKLIREIKLNGPISLANFMQFCLLDKDHGYYQKQNPFGKSGDFITAPEISQIFAELIALFAVYECEEFRSLPEIQIVELGPGNGALLFDFLRTAQKFPWFFSKLSLHLVEASTRLRKIQQEKLKDFGLEILHYGDPNDLPKKPSFIIANEFFDALPILQFEFKGNIWFERKIDFVDGEFRFCLLNTAKAQNYVEKFLDKNIAYKEGSIFEVSPATISNVSVLSDFILETKSKALIIDYGYGERDFKPTIQALKDHKYHPLFADLGQADITALVDFSLLQQIANEKNLAVIFTSQGNFLNSLGLEERVKMLTKNQPENIQTQIKNSAARLTDSKQMGEIFQVLYLS